MANGFFFPLQQSAGQQVVEDVATLVGDNPASKGTPDQIQVAEDIQGLVAGAFIGESEGVVDGAGFRDDKDVFGSQVLPYTARPSVACIGFE